MRIAREDAGLLARCAVAFEPGDPARTGRLAFWDPDGAGPPDVPCGVAEDAGLATADGLRTLPVRWLTVADALPVLALARRLHDGEADGAVHPSAAFWGSATALALHLAARERLLPGVSAGGYDAWRAGPLDPEDVLRLRELADAAPPEALAVPVPGHAVLPEPGPAVRAFLDAVADTLPRTAAAESATGRAAFAAVQPQHVPQLRAWAEEIAVGIDAGVRVSLAVRLVHGEDGEPAGQIVPLVSDLADPTVALTAAELFDGAPHVLGPRAQAETVRAVRRAAGVWDPLSRLLPVPRELDLDDGEFGDLLGGAASRLRAHGIDVRWPDEAEHLLTARAVVGADRTPPTDLRSVLGGEGTVDLRWQVCFDGDPLTEEETAAVAEANRPVVRVRGRWVFVGPALARKVRDRLLGPLTAMETLAVALTGFAEIDGGQVPVADGPWLDALRALLADTDADTTVEPPAALAATLRDYQLRGLGWLARMTSLGLGGCLADDMGLGKTIQLIALHLYRLQYEVSCGPTLVVCPASLLGNWEREVRRFAPGTAVRRFHGPGRSLAGADSGFVLTTYGTMRLDTERLGGHSWGMVVADEAQHVKNASSATAKALRQIPADARIALTGTPVENSLSELWAVLDWTTPGLLGSHAHFRRRWIAPIDAERAGTGAEPGTGTAARLAGLVRPFLLRRRKSDPGVAPELPPKTETDRPVALTAEQTALYEEQVRAVMAEIRSTEGIARSGLVLKLLTGLKQICNHPAQFLKEEGAKLSGRSGKLALLDELLDTILTEDGAALVFTQYVAMARLLERHLRDRGIPAQLLHGGTPVARREEMVRRFQDGEVPVFLLSLKAAGTGLNLTRADHVVHYDRWWNPAVEAQATDRAYRIGQTRPVQVHRMIAEGTVEDRIATLLAAKQELADAVIGSGEQALSRLGNDELANLVELRSAE
ncbi:DEAD/DEAH box helicase [Streptomyces afghaniensis]|uniref:DEAD/DEAH box helicase n=1 Tax=Streptomyces afghaniensis TaxID=66865 RepID=UPI00277E814A|nr:DEAD/DEAH box helicase [Streptomyces afghaniensis]MDQ1016535.1 superfamily II DNA or RNA helicase [Streptomyces afghaniensis]